MSVAQFDLAISNKVNIEPSLSLNMSAEAYTALAESIPGGENSGTDDFSANLPATKLVGFTDKCGPEDGVSETQYWPPGLTLSTPITCASTVEPTNQASTFVESLMRLCRRDLASEGVNEEIMLLLLVKRCGVVEAMSWAEQLGFADTRSYRELSRLLYGKHLSDAPNVIG